MVRPLASLAVLVCLLCVPALAEPNCPVNSAVYRVSFQCPGEPPRIFEYSGARHVPSASEVKLETEWYWARSRVDRGAGCSIVSVDGQPFNG